MKATALLFVLLSAVGVRHGGAFTGKPGISTFPKLTRSIGGKPLSAPRDSSVVRLEAVPLPLASIALHPVRTGLIATAAALLLANARSILWPNTARDKAFAEPLPPGSLGCPFAGSAFFWGSKDYGVGAFYLRQAKKLADGGRSIWKYYFAGRPFVIVTGAKRLKALLGTEFDPAGIETVGRDGASLLGNDSLLIEKNRERHAFLRKLVGQTMTPTAIGKSFPSLQQAAEEQAERMLAVEGPVRMETICTDYTLDVAWRQILGLNLPDEEIPIFHEAVNDWVSSIASIRAMFNIGLKKTKGYKAHMYLEKLIENKIAELERNGPDASTLSGMVFAADEEDPTRKLDRREVIDNALLLILAGSETSASTLMNTMLSLGLRREAWEKLVTEQRACQAKYGDRLERSILDKECPYLEGVIKESLRLKTVPGGIPRRVKETMVIDGKQVPKGWLINWNPILTHFYDPKTYKEDGSHMDVAKGFLPERWLSEDTTPAEFVPFGASPRYCLGANLAYAEMKVFLATLARKIDCQLSSITDHSKVQWRPMGIIPKEKDGVLVTVKAAQATKVAT